MVYYHLLFKKMSLTFHKKNEEMKQKCFINVIFRDVLTGWGKKDSTTGCRRCLPFLNRLLRAQCLYEFVLFRVDAIFLWVIVMFIVHGFFFFGSSLYWSISSDWSTWWTSWLCIYVVGVIYYHFQRYFIYIATFIFIYKKKKTSFIVKVYRVHLTMGENRTRAH